MLFCISVSVLGALCHLFVFAVSHSRCIVSGYGHACIKVGILSEHSHLLSLLPEGTTKC